MSSVEVLNVPTSVSAEELRGLFGQFGEVTQLLVCFEAGACEGSAYVAYSTPQASIDAVELLDSYPLATSLIEVRPVSTDRFVTALAGRLLASFDQGSVPGADAWPVDDVAAAGVAADPYAAAASSSGGWDAPLPPQEGPSSSGSGGGGGGGGVSALEEEMRQLQLHLQQHAEDIQHLAATSLEERRAQHAQQQYARDHYGGEREHQAAAEQEWEEAGDDGWHAAAPRQRKQRHVPPPPQQQQMQQQQQGGGGRGGGGGGGGSGNDIEPNTGLWIGWIDMSVEKADLARALSRFGPVAIEHLQPADRLAFDGERYKWGIVRFQSIQDSCRAKAAIEKQVLPGISIIPLKVTFYQPHHRSGGY